MRSGMDDVIAAETALSHVDGEAGRLIIRGYDLETLAGQMPFASAVALLWADIVPVGKVVLPDAIGAGRASAFPKFVPLARSLEGLTPVEGMRLLLSTLGEKEAAAEPAGLLGAVGVAAAMAIRVCGGGTPVAPDATAGHAADVLRMATGRVPSADAAAALDAYLVTVIDHGLNASTFAARVVASTGADALSTVVAALCALKGPLHGGAPGPVLDMLDSIAQSGDARGWLEAAMDRGERLMGFGHRIYRTRDPRAGVLEVVLRRVSDAGERLELAEHVEREALALLAERKAERRLDVNVEFYTALLLDAVGLPRSGFTSVFAAGRAAGWLAHAAEQSATGRLIRPQSRYVGSIPGEAA